MILPVLGAGWTGVENSLALSTNIISKIGIFILKALAFFSIIYISFLIFSTINEIGSSKNRSELAYSQIERAYIGSVFFYFIGVACAKRSK